MSRISYCDEEDFQGQFALWRANVNRSLAGARGREALRDLEAALLALPEKRLIADDVAKDGEVCAVGAIVAHRKVSLGQAREAVLREMEGYSGNGEWSPDEGDTEDAGVAVGIPRLVAWRLVELNDMDLVAKTPEERYESVLKWVQKKLAARPTSAGSPQ